MHLVHSARRLGGIKSFVFWSHVFPALLPAFLNARLFYVCISLLVIAVRGVFITPNFSVLNVNHLHLLIICYANYYVIDYEINKPPCALRNTHIAIIIPSGV